jgi:hypothetical protein
MKMPPLRQTQSPIAPLPKLSTQVRAIAPRSAAIGAKPSFRGLSHELGSGRKLPEAVQQKMETAFSSDFSDVRIHEGAAAESIGAIAYTQGSQIHFAPGKFNPMSQGGQELLGHELAHVVQQRTGRVSAASPINTDAHLEAEADDMGAKAVESIHSGMNGAEANLSTQNALIPNAPIQLKKKFKDKDIDRNGRNIDSISGGAVNTVDLVTYKEAIGSRSRTGFFKVDIANGGEIGMAAEDIGIDRGNPQLANRAVASSRMAALLRNKQGNGPGKVIAETVFARHNHQEGTVSEQASGKSLKAGVAVRETDPAQIQIMTGKNYNDPQERETYFNGGGNQYRPGNSNKKLHPTQKQHPQGPNEYEDGNGFYRSGLLPSIQL